MGKAARWFRGLFGIKKDKENVETVSNCNSDINKEKKRWSFAKSGKEIEGQVGVNDSAWLRSYISQTEKDQNQHAIAVAAATKAAADAAVAAAQAAVAVVRLTSHGRGTMFNGGREKWAAIKIQNVFRGYLARKALRALKGLVKLQALVRGYLVRKRAAATYHSMQALFRAQTAVRSQRARRSINSDSRYPPEMRRRSIERFDDCRSEYHSRRLSASYDASLNGFEESPKIVEIDTINKHRSRSRRINVNSCMSDFGDDHHYQHQHSHYHHHHHPCPFPTSARLSIPDCHHFQEFDWNYVVGDDYKFATAQSTPRFANPHPPVTPSKSVCGESFFRAYSNHPSYMANTLSSRAKSRSQSAPKQRPEPGPKKRLSLNEIMASRTSFSGVRMQKPFTPVQEDYSAF